MNKRVGSIRLRHTIRDYWSEISIQLTYFCRQSMIVIYVAYRLVFMFYKLLIIVLTSASRDTRQNIVFIIVCDGCIIVCKWKKQCCRIAVIHHRNILSLRTNVLLTFCSANFCSLEILARTFSCLRWIRLAEWTERNSAKSNFRFLPRISKDISCNSFGICLMLYKRHWAVIWIKRQRTSQFIRTLSLGILNR